MATFGKPKSMRSATGGVGLSLVVLPERVKLVLQVLLASLVVAFGAQVRIYLPGTEVPMTLQSMAVLLVGLTLPRWRAASAMAVYLACGVAGLPVLAVGSAGLFGSTGGFLVGFIVAAWLIAVIRGNGDARYARLLLAGGVGLSVLFLLGTIWRLPWYNWHVLTTMTTGIVPFVPKAVVQIFLAATLVFNVQRFRRDRKTKP